MADDGRRAGVRIVMRSLFFLAVAAATVLPRPVAAQPRGSERGSVTQRVNGTVLTVDYSRPVARGRTNLFGGVVHWGEVWTPGANYATTLETSKPIQVNGHDLAAGIYSVWMVPQPDRWTVRFHRDPKLYHDSPVPEDGFVLEVSAMPEESAHMEALAWYFPVVGPRTTTLHMQWGTTVVPLEIETRPFEIATVPAAERARYVGAYAVSGRDPTTGGPMEFTLTILEEDGRLAGRWGRAPVLLVPEGPARFRIGFMRNGELFDVGDEMGIRMLVEGGRASALELLWEGEPFTRAERVGER